MQFIFLFIDVFSFALDNCLLFLIVSLWTTWNFLYPELYHLRIVLFFLVNLDFFSLSLSFSFLISHWRESLVQCWIDVSKLDIFAFLLILGGKHSVFYHNYMMSAVRFFIDTFVRLRFSLILLVESFYHKWVLKFIKCFSLSFELTM